MTDISTLDTTFNGNKPLVEKDKAQGKQAKKQRYLPTLPSLTSASDMNEASYSVRVDKVAIDWSTLENYEVFSMTPDGSFPMIRISCSKAVRLTDRKVYPCGGGRVYRVSLSSH